NSCSAAFWFSWALISPLSPPASFLPKPTAARPAIPRGILANLALREELRRTISDTYPSWRTEPPLCHRNAVRIRTMEWYPSHLRLGIGGKAAAYAPFVRRSMPDPEPVRPRVELKPGTQNGRALADRTRDDRLQSTQRQRGGGLDPGSRTVADPAEQLRRDPRPVRVVIGAHHIRAARAAGL